MQSDLFLNEAHKRMEAIGDNRKSNKKKKRGREKDAKWKRDREMYYTKKKMTEWYTS